MNPRRGLFVVLEGPEGAGKSTLTAALAARLQEEGADPLVVREPGGTAVAELLRAELLDREREWTAEAELLYMVTARADLVARVIRPALAAGRLVVSDRFDLSTRAYQGAGRGVEPAYLEWANHAATGGVVPDLTLILDIPAADGLARQVVGGKRRDRLDREDEGFHHRVAEFYRGVTGPGIRHLDAGMAPAELAEAAWRVLCEARAGRGQALEPGRPVD